MGTGSSFYQSNPASVEAIPASGPAQNVYAPTFSVVRVQDYSASSGTVIVDWSDCDHARVTAQGNITISFINAINGQKCVLETIQDATGSRVITLPTAQIAFATTLPAVTLTTTANSKDKLGFIYNSGTAKYDLVAALTGF